MTASGVSAVYRPSGAVALADGVVFERGAVRFAALVPPPGALVFAAGAPPYATPGKTLDAKRAATTRSLDRERRGDVVEAGAARVGRNIAGTL
jgi:hypothetical protein